MKKKWRWLMMPLLAALFISAAGAAEVGTEQVLLDGDQAAFTPVSVEPIEINGVPTLTKTYEMPPDFDPAALKEQPFEQNGYWYRYDRTDKSIQYKTDTKEAEDTVTIDAPSSDLATVIDRFSVTKTYAKDGFIGDLTLDLQSIKVEATGYKTVTDSHPHSVTKSYTLPYNDRSLVPEAVQADGLSLPRTGLTWTETANVSDSDVPNSWTATAVYSKTTYTSRQVATGYQANAVYRGQIAKTSVDHVTYTVTYVGSKIPVMPFFRSRCNAFADRSCLRRGRSPAGVFDRSIHSLAHGARLCLQRGTPHSRCGKPPIRARSDTENTAECAARSRRNRIYRYSAPQAGKTPRRARYCH